MSHEEAQRNGQAVSLVERALYLEPSLKAGPADLVAGAERVLFALRVALEDAGASDPLAVMAEAVARYQRQVQR